MVFSTLLPTAIHLAVVATSLTGLWPLAVRDRVATWFTHGSAGDPMQAVAAIGGFSVLAGLPFVAAYALWWGAYSLMHGAFAAAGRWYLGGLFAISNAVGL